MKILVLNCGSSSIKYQLLEMPQETVVASGIVERIGEKVSTLKIEINGKKEVFEEPVDNHEVGVEKVIALLLAPERNIIQDKNDIVAVGHRIVHGGEYFNKSELLTPDAIQKIAECNNFAPLHNPANLKGIKAA
ncbi:MAG: acetate kinase, partial [Bacteroidales bacterium]|nr:acetate kinase [Bacteroidales bacterium]